MKQHLQRLGKLFFLSTLMLLISCQNDDPALSTHEGHAHADRNKISMAQFRNETLIKDFKPLAQVPVAQNSIAGKNTAPEDFAIDTVAIKKHIDETGSITYSFRIYPLEADADTSKKFNLVYIKQDNVWQTSILSFKANENPSNQNQALYSDLENLYDSRIGGGSNICVTETWSVQCDGSCHGSCDGFNCPTGQCLKRSVSVFSCSGGGGGDTGGGGSPNPGSPVTPGGGGNAPVNPYQFTPNILENPIFDSPEYLRAYRAQSFWEAMSLMNAQGWASQNSSIYLDILNSLLDNYNIENIEFAKEMVSALIGGSEVDINNQIILAPTFNNNQKAKCVFVKMISQNQSFFKSIIDNTFASSKTAFLKFEIKDIPPEPDGTYQALTTPIYNNSGNRYYNITLDRNFVNNASTIEIAFTLIHELIHAELLERCIKLNLVRSMSPVSIAFYDSPLILSSKTAIFNALINHYLHYNGSINSQWNHDLMNVFNYRAKISAYLAQVHSLLDPNNNFANALNSSTTNPSHYSENEVFEFISWLGLEGTQDYINLSQNTKNNINYFDSFTRTNYTQNCNN